MVFSHVDLVYIVCGSRSWSCSALSMYSVIHIYMYIHVTYTLFIRIGLIYHYLSTYYCIYQYLLTNLLPHTYVH